MLRSTMLASGPAAVPLGVALIFALCGVYALVRHRPTSPLSRLFGLFGCLAALWHGALALFVAEPLVLGLQPIWDRLTIYGLILLALVYWALTRAFFQLQLRALWILPPALSGLALTLAFDLGLLTLPPSWFILLVPWVGPADLPFAAALLTGALLLSAAGITIEVERFRTHSPAHRNRIQYLRIALFLLGAGFALLAWAHEPLWTLGLVLIGLAGVITAYLATNEDLRDLGEMTRRTLQLLVLGLITVLVYLAGIYLVQLFLAGALSASIVASRIDPTLFVAAFTAVLLTLIYTPIRKITRRITNRLLYGQPYDYLEVIPRYTQAVSNIIDLDALSQAVLGEIDRVFGNERGALLIVDAETDECLTLRARTTLLDDQLPPELRLTHHTPVLCRFTGERQPLAQYTIDISPQFKSLPADDRRALRALDCEWYFPILKQERLVGVLALGPRRSGRPYTSQDVRLLASLADQTALALENATLVDRLQRNLEETTRLKNLMDNVFESIDNGVITVDIVGNITFLNRAAGSMLRLAAERALGAPYLDVMPSFAKTPLAHLVLNVTNREDHYSDYEITSDLPGRGQVNLSLDLAPLKDARDQIQGVAMVVDDITETKRLRAVQNMFRRYVSPAVVDRLPADPADLQLGGQRQIISVLFADIRGFTSFSERLAPEALVDTLNQYLSIAASSILMYEGTLDKFMGDAVMGIFNAPLEQPDHTLRAVRAARAMQRAISEYHRAMGKERELRFGIGLHLGEAVVGNVGMSDRMDYTAIGDTVNVAKRIQENTPGGLILISEEVYQAVRDQIKAVFYKELHVKGRERPVRAYEVVM